MTPPGYHKWILILLVAVGSIMRGCYLEQVVEEEDEWIAPGRILQFDHVDVFADLSDNLLLYTLPDDSIPAFTPFVQFGDNQSVSIEGTELSPGRINDLGAVAVNHPYTVRVRDKTGTETFELYFTTLPVVRITSDQEIRDEPKVLSQADIQFTLNSATVIHSSYAGIEIRGRTSAQLEKKSYGLELWKDKYGDDISNPLLGMRNGEDWILDAMYIDPLRMRNKLSFELWKKMWNHRGESPWKTGNPGIQSEFVELFINQRYMGLYCLSEKLDEKLVRLDEGPAGTEGVMYKAIDWNGGGTSFKTYSGNPPSSMIWEGWEQVWPDDFFYWEPLASLRESVVMDEDELFVSKIDSMIDLDCMAEYYLFVNLLLGHDNIIKNYFLARHAGESRFLILPWDLEGTWGIMWNGDPSSSGGLVGNNLFSRLMELDVEEFDELLEKKWNEYRRTIFQLDSLVAPAMEYTARLKQSGAVERENRRWGNAAIDMDHALRYLTQWTTQRLDYLDNVF